MRIARPLRPARLTEILRIRGAPVYVHWSVFVIAALMLAGAGYCRPGAAPSSG